MFKYVIVMAVVHDEITGTGWCILRAIHGYEVCFKKSIINFS